jgi:hypothetical protein
LIAASTNNSILPYSLPDPGQTESPVSAHLSRKANRRESTQCGNPPPGDSRTLADLPLVERAFGANYHTVFVVDPDGYRTETYCARAA